MNNFFATISRVGSFNRFGTFPVSYIHPTSFKTPVSELWSRGFCISSGLIGNCPAGHENSSYDDEWPLTKEKTPQATPPAINKETSVLPTVRSTRTTQFKETTPGDKAALNAYLIQGSSIFTAISMLNLGITIN